MNHQASPYPPSVVFQSVFIFISLRAKYAHAYQFYRAIFTFVLFKFLLEKYSNREITKRKNNIFSDNKTNLFIKMKDISPLLLFIIIIFLILKTKLLKLRYLYCI